MNTFNDSASRIDPPNERNRVHSEGYLLPAHPSPYQDLPTMQPQNTFGDLSRDRDRFQLPPPSSHIPTPYHSPMHPQQGLSQPQSHPPSRDFSPAHPGMTISQPLNLPSLPEDTDLPPVPSLFQKSNGPAARPSGDEINVVDSPAATARVANRQRSSVSALNQSTEPPTKKRKGGRSKNSTGFSTREDRRIIRFTGEIQPIGMDGWAKVYQKYQEWAKKKGYPERTVQSVKKRFDRLGRQRHLPFLLLLPAYPV